MSEEIDSLLVDSTRIDPINVKDEFVRVSADMAYWGEQFAQASRTLQRKKLNYEQVRAALWLEKREGASRTGKKPPTVDDIKAMVETADELDEAKGALIDAEYERDRIKAVLEAVRAKKDMLISFGAHVRAEMNGDPVIREFNSR